MANGGGIVAGAKNFTVGSGAPEAAANEINLGIFNATRTQDRTFRESEENLLNILEGFRTGAVDTRTDAERALELLQQQGAGFGPQSFGEELTAFIREGEPAGGVPGLNFGNVEGGFGESFRNILQSKIGELLPRGKARLEGGGLAGRVSNLQGFESQLRGDISNASTIGGLDERLGQVFGSQNFQNLRDERLRAVQGQLGAGGLSRSGTALREISDVPTQLGFGLENQQFNRQNQLFANTSNQFNTALQQQIGLRTAIENLRQGKGANVANLQLQKGQTEASAKLGTAQEAAANISSLVNTIAGVFSFGQNASAAQPVIGLGDAGGTEGAQFLNNVPVSQGGGQGAISEQFGGLKTSGGLFF